MPANFSGKTGILAGSGSALIASLLVYPADMLKTRLIVQNVKPSKLHYRGIVHGFREIWKAEGFFAFYKGLLPTFLGKYLLLSNDPCKVDSNFFSYVATVLSPHKNVIIFTQRMLKPTGRPLTQ